MLFNSVEFAIFFALVFFCWAMCSLQYRWIILLVASYSFYYYLEPWYCLILAFSTLSTWLFSFKIASANREPEKQRYLVAAILANLLPLFFFKYFNFFIDSIAQIPPSVFAPSLLPHIEILLPIGISFYTFQAISYCLDIYRTDLEPEGHAGYFALYLSFFPKLISGPIERGSNLIPQLHRKSSLDLKLLSSGALLFFFGLFKKTVIADRLGMYVDMVFNSPETYYGKSAILASWLFSLQIYCDFSAYMDMAIGCSRIFGIELNRNFYFPYFAVSISDFWRRWHITLTSWFRDYVYIPAGGNRLSSTRFAVNIMMVFLLSGLWHGAAWTFLFWGGLHGLYYLLEKFCSFLVITLRGEKYRTNKMLSVLRIFVTFNLISFAWIFFRADSISDALRLITNMFTDLSLPLRMMSSQFSTALTVVSSLLFIALELVMYQQERVGFRLLRSIPLALRFPAYTAGLLMIALLGVSSNTFIYFHF